MRKLTPKLLAKTTPKLKAIDEPYNYYTQNRVFYDRRNVEILAATTTWHATQTFDLHGRPKDRDNDKD